MATPQTHPKVTKEPVDRRKKFISLANSRMSKLIKQIRQVQNLSNKHAYEYTDADVKTLITTLQNLVDQTEQRFKGNTNLAESFDITRPAGVK